MGNEGPVRCRGRAEIPSPSLWCAPRSFLRDKVSRFGIGIRPERNGEG